VHLIRLLLPAFLLSAGALSAADKADASTLEGKVLLGYQGWFNCPGDGAPANNWRSWARGVPVADTLNIDLYPDLSELEPDERCAVPGMTIGGDRPAWLFTAFNRRTVVRHFRWMKEYGLDGVLVQRFVGTVAGKRAGGDVVLRNVIAGAGQYGRVLAIEYDITGGNPEDFIRTLKDDWTCLVDEFKLDTHPNYLRYNGKPLVSVWGIGLNEPRHPPETPAPAKELIAWFQSAAPAKYQAAYMGGTPSRWRLGVNDARADPEWAEVYRMMDAVQPWTVGRYRDRAGVDKWKEEMPSDWYLRLSGEITRMFHGEIAPDPRLPEKPGPPWPAPAAGRK
jgi:hypothetical protein